MDRTPSPRRAARAKARRSLRHARRERGGAPDHGIRRPSRGRGTDGRTMLGSMEPPVPRYRPFVSSRRSNLRAATMVVGTTPDRSLEKPPEFPVQRHRPAFVDPVAETVRRTPLPHRGRHARGADRTDADPCDRAAIASTVEPADPLPLGPIPRPKDRARSPPLPRWDEPACEAARSAAGPRIGWRSPGRQSARVSRYPTA